MATFKVEYTTTDKPDPSALPPNASVEQLSALPAKVDVYGGRLKVRRRSAFLGNKTAAELAFEAVSVRLGADARTVGLSEDACREVAVALLAAADEFKAEREKTKREQEVAARRTAAARIATAIEREQLNQLDYRTRPW